MAQRYSSPIQWWFERLDAIPYSFAPDGTGATDLMREERLLESLSGEIAHLLPSARIGVYLMHPDSLAFHLEIVNNPEGRQDLEAVGAEQVRDGLFAWTLKTGQPAIVESEVAGMQDQILLLPLMTAQNVIGVCLILRDKAHGELSLEQLKILSVLGSQFAFLIENQRLVRRLEDQNQDLERQVQHRTRELESSLRSCELMNTKIVEATRLKSEFLANTSHELRTPLNSIIGFLHLIKDGLYAGEDEHSEFVQHSIESAQHLLILINDLLDVAKIEAGKMTVSCETVGLAHLLEEVRAILNIQAETKGLVLQIDAPPYAVPALQVDRRRLKQVLVNLIGNAVKFTASGSVRVLTQPDPDGQWCEVAIIDTGMGIPERVLSKLGTAFVQGDGGSTRRFGGTGLGLAISRSFIDLMGGTMTITSEGEGKGTTVTLRLPVAYANSIGDQDDPVT